MKMATQCSCYFAFVCAAWLVCSCTAKDKVPVETPVEKTRTPFAGDPVGSGGDMIQCKDSSGRTTRTLLDYFEARNDSTFKLSFAGSSETPKEKVRSVLRTLALFDKERAALYEARLDTFERDSLLVPGPLEKVYDTGPKGPLPPNCEELQWVIQRPLAFAADHRYVVDQDLSILIDADQTAGMMLHEIVFGEILSLGHSTSEQARRFNRFISDSGFATASLAEYEALAREVFAPAEKVDFREKSFAFMVAEGDIFHADLKPLLKTSYSGNISWSVDRRAPEWLEVVPSTHRLAGIAREKGKYQFYLVAKLGNSTAMTKIEIEVR